MQILTRACCTCSLLVLYVWGVMLSFPQAVTPSAAEVHVLPALQRFLLWQLRDTIIEPFGETAQQVFARISAARDLLDGPPQVDQGIVNTDPRL